MPTVKKYLGGNIIIQVRGTATTKSEIRKKRPEFLKPEFINADLYRPEQFCLHPDGSIRIVDYGDRLTIEHLKRTAA